MTEGALTSIHLYHRHKTNPNISTGLNHLGIHKCRAWCHQHILCFLITLPSGNMQRLKRTGLLHSYQHPMHQRATAARTAVLEDRDSNTSPSVSRVQQARTPGAQLSSTSMYTPLSLNSPSLYKQYKHLVKIQTSRRIQRYHSGRSSNRLGCR